jgi:hypothetical protein
MRLIRLGNEQLREEVRNVPSNETKVNSETNFKLEYLEAESILCLEMGEYCECGQLSK